MANGSLSSGGAGLFAGSVTVVSSTPYAQLSIGAGDAVTSTISMGKFCMYAEEEDGSGDSCSCLIENLIALHSI